MSATPKSSSTLTIVGASTGIAGIAYLAYKYLNRDDKPSKKDKYSNIVSWKKRRRGKRPSTVTFTKCDESESRECSHAASESAPLPDKEESLFFTLMNMWPMMPRTGLRYPNQFPTSVAVSDLPLRGETIVRRIPEGSPLWSIPVAQASTPVESPPQQVSVAHVKKSASERLDTLRTRRRSTSSLVFRTIPELKEEAPIGTNATDAEKLAEQQNEELKVAEKVAEKVQEIQKETSDDVEHVTDPEFDQGDLDGHPTMLIAAASEEQ